MGNRTFRFNCTVEVWDAETLRLAALGRYFKEVPGATSQGAVELLGTNTNPKINACIQGLLVQGMLGATIIDSGIEESL